MYGVKRYPPCGPVRESWETWQSYQRRFQEWMDEYHIVPAPNVKLVWRQEGDPTPRGCDPEWIFYMEKVVDSIGHTPCDDKGADMSVQVAVSL